MDSLIPLVVTLIKEVGFPIVVALFVLVRLNGKFDKLAEALRLLTGEIVSNRLVIEKVLVHAETDARPCRRPHADAKPSLVGAPSAG